MAELSHLDAFSGPGNPRLRIVGAENVEAARAAGKGVLLVGCHFGNWELVEVAARTIGVDGVVAVQHSHNPFLIRWLARRRFTAGFSEQIGTGDGVYRVMRRRLADGQSALMLCDQRVGNGIKAPFFGLETTTNVIPARLARTLPIAVIPMMVRRLGGARFEFSFQPELLFEHSGDADADERAFMARINRGFEQQMLSDPGQWLWLNPRWDDVLLEGQSRRRRGRKAGT
jgi:KDO2-lipid IV(A) lauroyltransferase